MRRKAKIAVAVFFGCMLALTFCSRTIYRALLPQVRTEKAAAGVLEYGVAATEWKIDADEMDSVCIPAQTGSLTVERVLVRKGDYIEREQTLLKFYAPSSEAALERVQSDLETAKIALREHEIALMQERSRLKERMNEETNGEKLKELGMEAELLQDGIMGGTALSELQREYEAAAEAVRALLQLQGDGWELRSPVEGTAAELSVKDGAAVSGYEHLLYVIPPEQEIRLGIGTADLPDTRSGKWTWKTFAATRDGETECLHEGVKDGVLYLALPDGLRAQDVVGVSAKLQSGYYDMLLPVGYLDGESVWVMVSATGDWGETVWRAVRREPELGPSDGKNVVVLSGLSRADRIIISSAKPLTDGQDVIPEGYAD